MKQKWKACLVGRANPAVPLCAGDSYSFRSGSRCEGNNESAWRKCSRVPLNPRPRSQDNNPVPVEHTVGQVVAYLVKLRARVNKDNEKTTNTSVCVCRLFVFVLSRALSFTKLRTNRIQRRCDV